MNNPTPKILVIRFSSLGDVILSTVVFPNLKSRWPQSEVYVLTRVEVASLFDDNPSVDHVLVFDPTRQPYSKLVREIREARFDILIDLQGNLRSWFIRLLAGAPWTVTLHKVTMARRILVWTKKRLHSLNNSVRERMLDTLPPLDVPIKYSDTQLFPKVKPGLLSMFSIDPKMSLIGIAPGARHNTKQWSPERFAEAANRLGEIPNTLVLVLGDKNDQLVSQQVFQNLRVPCRNLTGWTTLPDLVGVVSKLSLLITNDSGLLHMGEALGIPLVAIFGPTVRAFGFAPYRQTSRVVEVMGLSCRPCSLHGDERCPLGHHRCMEEVDVNAVVYATSELLEKNQVKTY